MAISLLRFHLLAGVILLLGACASLPGRGYPRVDSHALQPNTAPGLLGVEFRPARSGDVSGFRILLAGLDGLLARVELIEGAQRSLDLQYFIFRGDESGKILSAALLRAADRGVRIRILVDDGSTVAGDEKLLALTAHENIQVRIFNPFRYRGHTRVWRALEFLVSKNRLDYRMHNKVFVADNAVALLGGRNLGDQYFQINPGSQFGDDDVVAAGPIVAKLSGTFDLFWNSREAIPATAVDRKHTGAVELRGLRAALAARPEATDEFLKGFAERLGRGEPLSDIARGTKPLVSAKAQLLYDAPDKRDIVQGDAQGSLLYKEFSDQAKSVRNEMIMITPYLIPTTEEMDLIKAQRARGANVRILTNSLYSAPDPAAQAGYMHYRPSLLEEGVELHEIRGLLGSGAGSGQSKNISRFGHFALHGKVYVFDRKNLFIGSMNYDQRSKHLNTEIGLLLDSPELAEESAARFDALTRLDNAYAVEAVNTGQAAASLVWRTSESGVLKEFKTEPARNGWQRFKVRVLSWLPIDDEL